MNKVLNKRILRDLRANLTRYIALLLMIVAGMFIVISVVGAADTVITGTTELAFENKVEDGQFSVFIPLTDEQVKEITDSGVTIEKIFSTDVDVDDSTLRLMKTREDINLIHLDSGELPSKMGEAVIEKRYAEEHHISIGDSIEIYGTSLAVTGIGTVPEYDMPLNKLSDTSVESSLFGLLFVTPEQYDYIIESNSVLEEYCYAYRLNDSMTDNELKEMIQDFAFDYNKVENKYFREMLDRFFSKKEDLQEGDSNLYDGAGEIYQLDIDNLCTFIKAEDNPRILAAATDMQTNKTVGLMAGVIVMLLFTYVISVFVVHQIQRESSVIGALYALGAKKRDIIRHYITLPTIVCTVGGMLGLALAFSNIGIPWQMTDSYNYFSIPALSPNHPMYLVVYAVLMPPVVSIIVNYILISKKLSKTALSLMRNQQNVGRHSKVKLGDMGFIRRFQVRQMLRETRTGITVILGMFICMLIFMLGMNCYVLCHNIKTENAEDTKYEYMYNLKYPEEAAPENTEACYVESLSKTSLGHTLDVSVIGVDKDNKYYSVKPKEGRNSIVASASTAQKYKLSVGDKLILSDTVNDIDYTFTVEEIADYSVGLTVFMDIDSMRELFGQDEDYYNMLLSDEELDIDGGRVYSVTTKADVEKSASVFVNQMKGMFTMLVTMSIIIFCVVMYLMLNVMIDRASFGISLVKIFGYKTKEIRKLYLDGNALTMVIGAIISIPSAKVIMDALYPYFIAQNGCGLNLHFPWYLYAMIFVVVMIFYYVVSSLLVRKIKKITPAEVLKNRE